MAKLERLAYQSPRELLAEKFHMSEQLLSALNKGKTFDREGIEIVVANVAEMELATGAAHSAKRLRNAAADIPTKTLRRHPGKPSAWKSTSQNARSGSSAGTES
jgi:hypothetical protein